MRVGDRMNRSGPLTKDGLRAMMEEAVRPGLIESHRIAFAYGTLREWLRAAAERGETLHPAAITAMIADAERRAVAFVEYEYGSPVPTGAATRLRVI